MAENFLLVLNVTYKALNYETLAQFSTPACISMLSFTRLYLLGLLSSPEINQSPLCLKTFAHEILMPVEICRSRVLNVTDVGDLPFPTPILDLIALNWSQTRFPSNTNLE